MTALQASVTESRRPTPAGTRFVDVRANLMPDEVLSARQTEVVRRRVLTALAGLVALLMLGFGASWLQTHSARGDLADLNRSIAGGLAAEGQYAKVAQAQNDVQQTRAQLAQLMVGDLQWQGLLTKLVAAEPAGLTLSSFNGALASATSAAGQTASQSPVNASGKPAVGSVTFTGTAPDAKSVAAYSDALTRIKGLTSVMVTSVTGGSKGVTFTATAALTSDILGGRFTPTTGSQGGH